MGVPNLAPTATGNEVPRFDQIGVGGGGGDTLLDGGSPSTLYGGAVSIDGGTP